LTKSELTELTVNDLGPSGHTCRALVTKTRLADVLPHNKQAEKRRGSGKTHSAHSDTDIAKPCFSHVAVGFFFKENQHFDMDWKYLRKLGQRSKDFSH